MAEVHPTLGGGLFVTGTDTGVGKTVVSCALIRAFCERGIVTAGMKPIETGVGPAGPLDAMALRDAAGGIDPLGDVCPQQFALPAAPNVAAEAENRRLDFETIHAAYHRLAKRGELVLVEGAGGLLVPIAEDFSMASLAQQLGLPVLIVARASLGTINHTLLTLEAAESRGLPTLGVIVSHGGPELSDADAKNLGALRKALGERLLGEIPFLEGSASPPLDVLGIDAVIAALRALE